jgi:AraC-like DNA-binding protein
MAFSKDALACFGSLLTRRLEMIEVERRSFPPGAELTSSVVHSYRLLFVCSGVVHYAMEDWSEKIGAGTLLLVPAWMKRGWRAGSRRKVDLQWVSFNPVGESHYQEKPFHWKSDNVAREGRSFSRILSIWRRKISGEAGAMMMEGEMKALLGRLAYGNGAAIRDEMEKKAVAVPAIVNEIIGVAAWIEQHYARPDVLSRAASLIYSSDHYFRMRFRQRTGFTLGQYTAMVRMRRARYLLSSSPAPVKDVAWQVGYRDPLHFSRCYRNFWGRAPRMERK